MVLIIKSEDERYSIDILKFGYSEKATKFENIFHSKGSDHLAHRWGGLGRFLGSQRDRQLKFSAYATFLISCSLS